jgi:hypothetical protein
MGAGDIIELIKGILEFPAAILALIQILRKTPLEKHRDLLERMRSESQRFEETGRPTW